jgi:hypothetical protein
MQGFCQHRATLQLPNGPATTISPVRAGCRSTSRSIVVSAVQHADGGLPQRQHLDNAEPAIGRRILLLVPTITVCLQRQLQVASAEEALLDATNSIAEGDHASSTIRGLEVEQQPQEPSQQPSQQPEVHPFQYPFNSTLASNLSARDYW